MPGRKEEQVEDNRRLVIDAHSCSKRPAAHGARAKKARRTARSSQQTLGQLLYCDRFARWKRLHLISLHTHKLVLGTTGLHMISSGIILSNLGAITWTF